MFTCDHRTVTSSTSFPRGSTRAMNTGSTTPDDRPHTVSGYATGPHRTDASSGRTRRNGVPGQASLRRAERPPERATPRPGRAREPAPPLIPGKNSACSREIPDQDEGPRRTNGPGAPDRTTHRRDGRHGARPTGPPRTAPEFHGPAEREFVAPVSGVVTPKAPSAGTGSDPPDRMTNHRKQFPEKSLGKSRTEHPPPFAPPQQWATFETSGLATRLDPAARSRAHESHRTAGSYYTVPRAPRVFPPALGDPPHQELPPRAPARHDLPRPCGRRAEHGERVERESTRNRSAKKSDLGIISAPARNGHESCVPRHGEHDGASPSREKLRPRARFLRPPPDANQDGVSSPGGSASHGVRRVAEPVPGTGTARRGTGDTTWPSPGRVTGGHPVTPRLQRDRPILLLEQRRTGTPAVVARSAPAATRKRSPPGRACAVAHAGTG
ncbi:hypothetical protein FHR84_003876 [Actinopolyspora biskrensis]|uniref:Uncharacterized protein n=1 Tax=Actinopolyspora biskrensis TaxID=1470178 RepID=A0A852Z445_9ACTN|nr:hypothetical protein [Actinopolyspora biskrensis]